MFTESDYVYNSCMDIQAGIVRKVISCIWGSDCAKQPCGVYVQTSRHGAKHDVAYVWVCEVYVVVYIHTYVCGWHCVVWTRNVYTCVCGCMRAYVCARLAYVWVCICMSVCMILCVGVCTGCRMCMHMCTCVGRWTVHREQTYVSAFVCIDVCSYA